MSFGTDERKVRDASLPYARRINALRVCVERYRPLGFHVTFAYLEHVAGRFRSDEAALLRAMDALTAGRNLWLAEVEAFAQERRAAKRRGRRSPSAREVGPRYGIWYGDARNAALFALGVLLQPAAPDRPGRLRAADPEVLRLASLCVDRGGHLDRAHIERAAVLEKRFRKLRRKAVDPGIDWPLWHRAHDSLRTLHLIESALPTPRVDPVLPPR